MRVNQEPYNIEKIEIKSELSSSDFETTFIILEKFDGKRGEYSPENEVNKGILFDFQIKFNKTFIELSRKSFDLYLSLKDDNKQKCYELVNKTFIINVLDQKIDILDKETRQAIIYTLENISKKHDSTNSLQFRLSVPVAPVRIACELRLNHSFSTNEDILDNINTSAEVQYYNDIIISAGQNTFKLGKLNAAEEYYAKCVFVSTSLENKKYETWLISVTIGNFEHSDVFAILKPSRDTYRRSQCAHIKFKYILDLAAFNSIVKRYCSWVMTNGQSILVRLFSNIDCEIVDLDYGNLFYNSTFICAAPSPLLNIYKYSSKEEGKKFDASFDEFIAGIKDSQNLLNNLGIKDVVVKSVTKYYDETPDSSLLNYAVDVDKNNDTNIIISIISTNPFPIECYYNRESNIYFKMLGN